MKCAVILHVLLVLLGVSWETWGQYLNNRPFPTYSLEHMPDTSFTCRAKVLGGYYADAETQCQMFHVCVKVPGLGVQDFRFLCPNGTAFDQDSQICAEWDDVDCEAATLYYSSDNFDLYRLGSGLETAPFPGEEEATFHLQRSDTGDARLSREKETIRINQQSNYNTAVPPKPPKFNKERDIFRGSSSSNFFNNKNGGKENDDDYEEAAPNRNNDIPRQKIIRKLNRKQEEVTPTPKPKQTGFANNFAGSPYIPSTTGRTVSTTVGLSNDQYTTAIQNYRGRQRSRTNNREYNNADSFRNNDNGQNRGQYQSSTPEYNDGQYTNRNQFSQIKSTSAPFRQTENRQYKNLNRQPVQETSSTTAAPKQNYNQYESQRTRQQTQTTRQQNINQYKQTDNYPSTTAPFRQNYNKQTSVFNKKETENYPTGAPFTKTSNNQYDTQKTNEYTKKETENYPTGAPFTKSFNQYDQRSSQFNKKETENYPTGAPFTKQSFNNQYEQKAQSEKDKEAPHPTTSSFSIKQTYNNQYDGQKKPTTFKQTENYPTTFSPSKPTYQNKQTFAQKAENYPTTPEAKQTQFDYNTRQTTFNQQYNQNDYKYTNQQSTQYSTTNRPTTVHTQYTPTVPKQTTQYTYSTTPAPRSSRPYEESSYDDGSYNPKYDDDKYKSDDEFLKTAHSQNIASSRNELASSTKVNIPIPSKESPRPFTSSTPKPTPPKQTQPLPKTTSFNKPVASKTTEENAPTSKKEKDTNYDYAYYDTNIGSEPDYDIGTEFARSTKKSD